MKIKRKKKKEERSKLFDNYDKKLGRVSKLKNVDLKKLEQLAKYGCTQEQIASILGIHFTNLWENKKNRPEIRYAIKRGLELGNKTVQRSLHKRAKGFTVKAVHFTSYRGRVQRSVYDKYYPPSDIAAFFWLKNKAGWKDKPDDVFDQHSVMQLANKLVEIIVSEAPNDKARRKMLSRISDAFETLQSTKSGGDSAHTD